MMARGVALFLLLISIAAFGQTDSDSNTDSLVIVGKISWSGNNITRDNIITRELEFTEGDTLTKNDFQNKLIKSRENLMNRSLFNFVTFSVTESANRENIHINFVERWYIWPIPVFDFADRNINVWWETKDFSRLNYGIDLRVDNFRGRMETLHIILQTGYDKAAIARWEIPYVNKKQKLGVSVAAGIIYNRQINYININNKPVYHDFKDEFARKNYFLETGISYRTGYNSFHNLLLTFNNLWLNDSLQILNPDYAYKANQYNYPELYYKYKLDFRDYAPYPLNGYYFDVQFKKTGFGLLSDMNFTSLEFNFDQYFHIYNRFYFAYRLSALITNKNKFQPYLARPGIEIDDFDMRGYELYVINGQELGMFKSNFKFEIIPMKTHRIKWIKSEKFGKLFYALYANLFFDAAYAYDTHTPDNNPLGNQLLWSTGMGIDFVTFYDIVIRLEYSINKQKDTGFYVGLVAPI